MKSKKKNQEWKTIESLDKAKDWIIQCDEIEISEIRQIRKSLSAAEQQELFRYIAISLSETVDDFLNFEILADNFLIWLDYEFSQENVNGFVEGFLSSSHPDKVLLHLTHMVLGQDVSEEARDSEIFPLALALICELALALFTNNRNNINRSAMRALQKDINTHLLSVSNMANTSIRLSLIHYFGLLSRRSSEEMDAFNRIMGRFGHSMLDHLFVLLFQKKTESVAFSFLLENLPAILEANNQCQKMLHEAFKTCMLKHPERFTMFLNDLGLSLVRDEKIKPYPRAIDVFIEHVGALFKISSDVNHRPLAKELFACLIPFKDFPKTIELIQLLKTEEAIRLSLREYVREEVEFARQGVKRHGLAMISQSKKRKTAFAKPSQTSVLGQVNLLGAVETIKEAS